MHAMMIGFFLAPLSAVLFLATTATSLDQQRSPLFPAKNTPARRQLQENATTTTAAFPGQMECFSGLDGVFRRFIGDDLDDPNSLVYLFPITELVSNGIHYYLLERNFTVDDSQEYFGREGQFTDEVMAQHALIRRFWNDPNDVPLFGGHSEGLARPEVLAYAVTAVYVEQYGFEPTEEEVQQTVVTITEYINTSFPEGFSNNALTLFAFTLQLAGFVNITGAPRAIIVLGDGLLDKFENLTVIANDMIHAHEYAHTLQFTLNETDPVTFDTLPEQSRYIELEADAMATYFLAHKDGRHFNRDELLKVAQGKFLIGDCDPTSEGHHGTPVQRQCAGIWGANLGVLDATVLTPLQMRSMFGGVYESILSVDESVCANITNATTPAPTPPTPDGPPVPRPSDALGKSFLLVTALVLMLCGNNLFI